MSENKINICTILDPTFVECHDIIMKSLQDDLYTLYSCIRVNRFFCRNFVPILWRNPFKFVKHDKKLIEIFNTLIHCLEKSDKKHLINTEFINIIDLPTPNTYFKYNTFVREFELNPLQKGMRLWTLKYLRTDYTKSLNGRNRKRVGKRLIKLLNNYIGNLLFNEGNRYESLNIFYNDLLSRPKILFDMCEIDNYKESLIKVNKLSIGFLHRKCTNLIPHVREKFLKFQSALSPNIQHLQICIKTTKQHNEISKELINLIQYQRNLKSLSITPFWKSDEMFSSFLISLRKQSKSLTYLKLQDFRSVTTKLLSIIKSLPNLITLDLEIAGSIVSQEISALPASYFDNLEHLCFNSKVQNNFLLHLQLFNNLRLPFLRNILNDQIYAKIQLFEKILSSSTNLKSLKVSVDYSPSIIQVQRQISLNITHFHLVLNIHYPFEDLVIILTNFHRLVHLKLTSSNEYFLYQLTHKRCLGFNRHQIQNQNQLLDSNDLFRQFPKALAKSLKILEVNFTIAENYLEILFNEFQFNIQCIKLYRYRFCNDSLLRIFIDYARRKGCFKELGISRETINHFSKQYVEEAKNHFDITLDNNIDNPFYDVPINNRY